ncbi:MAG: hypothetical protein JWQ68_2033 [Cryobacterium sp.]|jgi:hypothetical protein|nr:hypothetical protein [Cryobacterium sp.]
MSGASLRLQEKWSPLGWTLLQGVGVHGRRWELRRVDAVMPLAAVISGTLSRNDDDVGADSAPLEGGVVSAYGVVDRAKVDAVRARTGVLAGDGGAGVLPTQRAPGRTDANAGGARKRPKCRLRCWQAPAQRFRLCSLRRPRACPASS